MDQDLEDVEIALDNVGRALEKVMAIKEQGGVYKSHLPSFFKEVEKLIESYDS